MKLIALGDTHGRDDWKRIIADDNFDKVVFIGDYFDTHEDIGPNQQKDNFRDLIAFKKANRDRVVLLFGNHDFHYLPGIEERYSGYQDWHRTDIGELLSEALEQDLMQMCYIHDNSFLFVHAGITKTWCRKVFAASQPQDSSLFERQINELFRAQPRQFGFSPGQRHNPYGDEICQSPIWVRPMSLAQDKVDGYVQVVGHTTQNEIGLGGEVILIDTLGTSGEYLSIIETKVKVCK